MARRLLRKMSRLIDADSISIKLSKIVESGECSESIMKQVASMLNIISIEQTAFDKDKVLKEMRNNCYEDGYGELCIDDYYILNY